MPPFWHWEWRGIWNKSWCGGALGECELLKGQRCPVGCLGLGMAPKGRIGFLGSGNSHVLQAGEMSWAVNSVSKVCPCPSDSQPWDPAWCSQRASTACFLGESGHTLCCTWQNDTFRDCRFSFYTYFISGGGQEFLSHVPQQHVGLAESKPGPPWGSQVWAFASGLVTQNWLWLTKVSPEVGIWKETFVHCGGITTEFYLITCQAN